MTITPNNYGNLSVEYNGEKGLKVENSEDLELKVINFRNRFYNLFLSRYLELLPYVIKYQVPQGDRASEIDWLKVEYGLRNNYLVCIGENRLGVLCVLGYATNFNTVSNPATFFVNQRLTSEDINFIIPEDMIPRSALDENKPRKLLEIVSSDNGTLGDFVVLRNKAISFQNDIQVIQHYAQSLSEIVASRFSLIIQSKVNTVLTGMNGNETLNQIISKMYNGAPFIKVTPEFNPQENIITLENDNVSLNLAELKREYQNQLNELNSMIGVDVLGVDKAAGVSDIEAKSGNPFSKNISNVYTETRNNALKLFNKRYGTNVTAVFDNNVSSEISSDSFIKED